MGGARAGYGASVWVGLVLGMRLTNTCIYTHFPQQGVHMEGFTLLEYDVVAGVVKTGLRYICQGGLGVHIPA